MATGSDRRILHHLKTQGPATAGALAHVLDITATGVRQHLVKLEEQGLVRFTDERQGVGRPKRVWRLAEGARERFPNAHDQLNVELLEAAQTLHGDDGLDALLGRRAHHITERYRVKLRSHATLYDRLKALCELRSEEGYMAELVAQEDGRYLLIENHCPIMRAAIACEGMCRSELEIFAALLAPEGRIERVEHALTGARRCAFRITPY